MEVAPALRFMVEHSAASVSGVPPMGALFHHWRLGFRQSSFDFIQDSSSFALKETLVEQFPGRFKGQNPAAVELQATLEFFDAASSRLVLTPDTSPERVDLPRPEELRESLLLADRGYFERCYLSALARAGAHFILRAPVSINPQVLNAFNAQGERLRRCCGKPLKATHLTKRGCIDMDVCWGQGKRALSARLLVIWNPSERRHLYLITNLTRARYRHEQVGQAYRLRWQVELLFKEYKSYANLHEFDTRSPAIAEGLIWAAIAAATIKRFMAHTTQLIKRVEVSSRKVAMCAQHVLPDLFKALVAGKARHLKHAFKAALEY